MTATYSLNGGTAVNIPNGIFTVPSPFIILVNSTSITDTGLYTITLTISDPLPASVTQTFKVNVTNSAPILVNNTPSHSIVHGKSISINLTDYFKDEDNDTLTMTATYSKNGGAVMTVPEGIFTKPAEFLIDVNSVGLVDVGIYTISLSVSDSLLTVNASFTLTITNERPRLNSTHLPAITAPQYNLTKIDLISFFIDEDGDSMTLTATYSFNGAPAASIL